MTASFKMTRQFLRGSFLRRLFRRWWLILIAVAMIVPNVVGDLQQGALGGVSTFGVVAVAVLVLRYAVGWYRQVRSIDEWLSKQGDVPVRYQFDEDSVTVESEIGRTTLKWCAFKQLTITSFHVLMEFPRGQGALTLPAEQVTAEVCRFICERFSDSGIPIKRSTRKEAG
ncbi:MAG: hypothetical protein ACQCXQ_02000 [Verrucomicrobiales bacterium]